MFCGYGIVCPSISICGSIFIYYKRALCVYGFMRSLQGRAKRVLFWFCRHVKEVLVIVGK